jgi:exonuclease III
MNVLKINGYELETDLANNTIRTAVYIKTTLKYEQMMNHGLNQNIIVLKLIQKNLPHLFISAIYRPRKNIDNLSQENAFENQINEMIRLIPKNNECIILGDFNINYAKRNNRNVVNRTLTQILKNPVENHSLEQMVSMFKLGLKQLMANSDPQYLTMFMLVIMGKYNQSPRYQFL